MRKNLIPKTANASESMYATIGDSPPRSEGIKPTANS